MCKRVKGRHMSYALPPSALFSPVPIHWRLQLQLQLLQHSSVHWMIECDDVTNQLQLLRLEKF
jgi:hypothetical protein